MAKTKPEDEFGKFYYNRWLRSETVGIMSITAQGCFQALMWRQMASPEGSIPENPEHCRRLIGATETEWAEFAPFLDQVFPAKDGRRVNATMAGARAERDAASARATQKGNLGGRPGEPTPNLEETKPKPTGEPNNNLQVNQSETSRLTELEVEEELELGESPLTPLAESNDFGPPTNHHMAVGLLRSFLPPEFTDSSMAQTALMRWADYCGNARIFVPPEDTIRTKAKEVAGWSPVLLAAAIEDAIKAGSRLWGKFAPPRNLSDRNKDQLLEAYAAYGP